MDDGPGGPRRFRGVEPSLLWALALVALLVVALAATAIVRLDDERRGRERAETAAANEAVAAATLVQMNELAGSIAERSAMIVSSGTAVLPPVGVDGFRRVDYLPADAPRAEIAGLLDDGVDVVALRGALDRARDGADVLVMSEPVGDPPAPAVIDPLYRHPDGSLSLTPSLPTTSARRTELDGYVLGTVDLGAVVVAPEGRAWSLRDGPVLLAGVVEVSGDTVTSEIDVIRRRWQLTTAVNPPARGAAGLVIVAIGASALFLLGFLGARLSSALAQRRRVADEARHRAMTVATLSGVMQQSHELGEVLPGMAVQLCDAIGLDGLSLAIASTEGGFRDYFSYGVHVDVASAIGAVDVDHVAAGATVSLHLHRAERSIAVLRVVAGRPLDPGDLELLRITAEMVTSAVITARSLEQQQDAVARLHVLDELKTAFLGTASHELRTPVTAISGFAQVLSDRWDQLADDDRRVFAERIASNSRALEVLVQDLLDFARIERGDHSLALEPIDLAGLVRDVLERLTPVHESHVVEAPDERPVLVDGDRAALERVVTNLVTNAVKFSPDGSTIRVGVRSTGAHALLEVDDEGPGVPPDERDKVFARFFRGSSQAVVRTRGVGIGLSVVEEFIVRMGGTIEVDDSPSGGARFRVVLAMHDAAASPDRETDNVEEDHDVPTA